jgi:hypothetical protein
MTDECEDDDVGGDDIDAQRIVWMTHVSGSRLYERKENATAPFALPSVRM